jgi:predicted nucleotidyltransferase
LIDFLESVIELDPVAVILFGSLGRGEYLEDSDADVAVILREERVNILEEMRKLKEFDELGLIEVFPYGYRQFKDMIEDVNPFAFEILEGIIVYIGDERIVNDIYRTMEEVVKKRKVRKTEYGMVYQPV